MRYFLIVIPLLLLSLTVQAQDVISVKATDEVRVPADEISFRILLNAEANTPQEAYELHQKREEVLVDLLREHHIDEKNIDFEPISITRRQDHHPQGSEQDRIVTRQQVMLMLNDFDLYEEIQVTLIDNGFDEFSGHFTSTESQKGEDEALRKALRTAREKADVIARESGLRIEGIKEISYSYNQNGPRPMMEMQARTSADSESLMDFEQMVSISASVSVDYNFK